MENSFKKIDYDGDGKLTKQEMLRGDEFTQEEVFEIIIYILAIPIPCPKIEAIFELGDVDGDGQIDMGEFVGKKYLMF